jgi:hypothetical protein
MPMAKVREVARSTWSRVCMGTPTRVSGEGSKASDRGWTSGRTAV